MYSDYVFSYGYLVAAIVFLAVATGVAEPLLKRVEISKKAALMWCVGVVLLSTIDGTAGALFMLLPAATYAGRCEGWLLSAAAFLAMLGMGLLMFGVMGMLGAATPYAGLVSGAVSGIFAQLMLDKRLVLAVACGSSAMAVLLSFVLEAVLGIVAPIAQNAYFDAAVTGAVAGVVLSSVRGRRRAKAV